MLLNLREVVDQRRFKQFSPNFAGLYTTNRTDSMDKLPRMRLTVRGLAGLEHEMTFLQLASFEPPVFNSQTLQNIASELSSQLQSTFC